MVKTSGWRSICSARSLVKKGLIKRVGTGQSISVWTDPWIPAPRPRSAIPKTNTQFLNPSLKVEHFINPIDCSWNVDLLNAYIHADDVKLIRGLAVSRSYKLDTVGWSFTESGKYSVKSGFRTESLYPDRVHRSICYGPTVKPLLAFSWKLKCPPKLRHFVWQFLSGTLPVSKNLTTRGIVCDTRCSMCGAEEESTNHVLFECPPALQTWALSRIPSSPAIFPLSSIFTNMDYLFWRLPKEEDLNYFPWILWYIWKARNDKIYSNKDGNPQEILRLAEVESKLWMEAQLTVNDPRENSYNGSLQQSADLDLEVSRVCYIDGAWKEEDIFTGQGWFCRKSGSTDVMMGAMNLRRSLSPLHAEFEALIWAMECMKTLQFSDVVFATDCSQLVKMVSTPDEWPAFSTHIEEFNRSKTFFLQFRIRHILRAKNTLADKLARGARSSPSALLYVDSIPPVWLARPVGVSS